MKIKLIALTALLLASSVAPTLAAPTPAGQKAPSGISPKVTPSNDDGSQDLARRLRRFDRVDDRAVLAPLRQLRPSVDPSQIIRGRVVNRAEDARRELIEPGNSGIVPPQLRIPIVENLGEVRNPNNVRRELREVRNPEDARQELLKRLNPGIVSPQLQDEQARRKALEARQGQSDLIRIRRAR